ncbi:MAG: aerolysin, partial [Elusimicrobia bacterium]
MRQWVVVALALAVLGSPAKAEVAFDEAGVKDRMMVVFDKSVPAADQKAMAARHGLEVIREFAPMNAIVVRPLPGKSLPSLSSVKGEVGVLAAGHDEWRYWLDADAAALRQAPLPSVGAVMKALPRLGKTVGKAEEIQWGVRRVNAPAAWARNNSGRGVKVGIVDTGIDPTHPEFAGRVVGGKNAIDDNQPWADDHSHGTHVAGIVAAALDNNGVVGVAPAANLYGIKVLTKEGSGSIFSIIGGIMWCVQNGMDVVNMSLGAAQGNQLFEMAVNQLASADIPLIAAAGNDGKAVNFP